ncbi:MAG: transcription antitermination factor NusB, partial [Flavisolibacter sp.]
MISRRNIRVKVMQTIYTLSTLEKEIKPGEPVKLLQKHFEQSKEMLVYLTYFLTELAAYAEKDSYVRSSKHLPSQADLNVNTKIAGNEILWKIKEDSSFQIELGRMKPEQKIDRELVKKIYSNIAHTPEYIKYTEAQERDPREEREILEFILNEKMLNDENFVSHVEELFMNWDDDAEMVIQLLVTALHKPGQTDFREVMSADKWNFAKSLLTTTLEKEEHLQTYIFP